jgi:hypothetical protein
LCSGKSWTELSGRLRRMRRHASAFAVPGTWQSFPPYAAKTGCRSAPGSTGDAAEAVTGTPARRPRRPSPRRCPPPSARRTAARRDRRPDACG